MKNKEVFEIAKRDWSDFGFVMYRYEHIKQKPDEEVDYAVRFYIEGHKYVDIVYMQEGGFKGLEARNASDIKKLFEDSKQRKIYELEETVEEQKTEIAGLNEMQKLYDNQVIQFAQDTILKAIKGGNND